MDSLQSVSEEEEKTSGHPRTSVGHTHVPPQNRMLRRRTTLKNIAQSITSVLSMRRKSRFFVGGMGSVKSSEKERFFKIENTYRVEPVKGQHFVPEVVAQIIQNVLDKALTGYSYDSSQNRHLVKELSDEIKSRVRDLALPRYKLVCNVIMGQNQGQGTEIATRSLWNPKNDNWACAKFENEHLFAVGIVLGIYFE